MKIISWNVNGLRAALAKRALDWVWEQEPDVVCLQEIKVHPSQLKDEQGRFPGYEVAWNGLLLLPPYLVLLALFLVGLARLRLDGGAWLLLVLLATYNAAHVVAYATTRFRLPVMPVVFMVGAAVLAGQRDGTLHPLRVWRLVLLAALALAALATLAPGLEELAAWRLLTGPAD